jgi:hypothetical protein
MPGSFELAHDPGYVRGFLEGRLDPQAIRRIGFPWSEGLVRRTLASVGSTLGLSDEQGHPGNARVSDLHSLNLRGDVSTSFCG